MISHLLSLMLAVPMGIDKTLSALSAKLSPSIHKSASLDAKMAMLAEANAPNHRSKAMEKALLETNHTEAMYGASTKIENSHAAYNELAKKCVACKMSEDAVVTKLHEVVSLHDYADEKLDEYNNAKKAAEEASKAATTLEEERDEKCAGETGGGEVTTTTTTTEAGGDCTPGQGSCTIASLYCPTDGCWKSAPCRYPDKCSLGISCSCPTRDENGNQIYEKPLCQGCGPA